MYHYTPIKSNTGIRPTSFTLETQGSVVKLAMKREVPLQQRESCADGAERWFRAQMAARRALVKMAEDERDPFQSVLRRIADNPDKKLVAILAQGVIRNEKRKHSTRGAIQTFSRKSRMRLITHAMRLKKSAGGRFLTFTYRQNMRDAKLAKHHLELMLLWLKREFPRAAFIWRMEYQERGAIHFHVIALNVSFVLNERLTERWQQITGDDSYPDNKPCRARRKLMFYISKYIAKVTQSAASAEDWVTGSEVRENEGGGDAGFISLPYPDNYTGRWWGVTNRKFLPLAERTVISVTDGDGRTFFELKRYARRRWRYMSRRLQGFTLFVDNPARWLELLNFVMVGG